MMRQRAESVPGRFKWKGVIVVLGLLSLMVIGYLMRPQPETPEPDASKPQEQQPAVVSSSQALAVLPRNYQPTPPRPELLAVPASLPPGDNGVAPPVPPTPPVPSIVPPSLAPVRSMAPGGQKPPVKTKAELAKEQEQRDAKIKQRRAKTISRTKDDRREDEQVTLKLPKTPYHLSAGALIPLIQEDAISSAAPGVAQFTVREMVWDSLTGEHPLIPPGTKVLVRSTGGQSAGTERYPVTALTLTFPTHGGELDIRAGHIGDASGQAGLLDQVDHKTGAVIATMFLQMFSRGAATALTGGYGGDTVDRVATSAAREGIDGSAQHAKTFLNTSPTFHVRAGYLGTLRLEKSVSLPGPYPLVGVSSAGRDAGSHLFSLSRRP